MKITFHGAAQCVTGSKHLIETKSGKQLLLDCGLFQGMGKETIELNTRFGFNPLKVDYMILSHAHIDHSGLIPKLVKEGYKGPIYCTPPTYDLVKLLLIDSAHIQESDVRHVNKIRKKQGKPPVEPLYEQKDAEKALDQLVLVQYEEDVRIDEDITFRYTDVGHILGSAAVNLTIKENGKDVKVMFSGDVGRYRDMLLRSPQPFPQADHIIIESTYGDRIHEDKKPSVDVLHKHIINTCLEKRGKLIIPAFSVGRSQELLYLLNQLENEGRLPDLKYYLDSPLSIEVTEVVKRNTKEFNSNVQELLETDHDVFGFKGMTYVQSVEQSKGLNHLKEPCVIISASGMAEAGRVKHHIVNNIDKERNTILIVGYCDPRSLGGKLRNGDKEVSIYGEMHKVKAEVETMNSLSAHADRDDLFQYLSCQDMDSIKEIFLVHGNPEGQKALRKRMMKKGFKLVNIPELHQHYYIS